MTPLRRALTTALLLALCASLVAATGPTFDACGDVHLVFARGSGLGTGAEDFDAVNGLLGTEVIADDRTFSAYELGEQVGDREGYAGHAYPASGELSDLRDAFLDRIPFHDWVTSYDRSVMAGIAEATAYVADRAASCPDEELVLAGFSQGAQVVGESLHGLDAGVRDRIAYVALFGDPSLDTKNALELPLECSGLTRSPWTRDTGRCFSAGGILGSRVPYVPADMEDRTGSWCAFGDGICTGKLRELIADFAAGEITGEELPRHFSYFRGAATSTREAVEEIMTSLAGRNPDQYTVRRQGFRAGVTGSDLVFVVDTTGSMWDEIDAVRREAVSIARLHLALSANNRVGLVQYRDHGDAFVASTELLLTDDASAFESALQPLRAQGGGDYPEAQLSGLSQALETMPWRLGATKAAIVITDAPGKDPEPVTGLTRDDISRRAIEIDPVALYMVNTGGSSQPDGFFAPMAEATDGAIVRSSGGRDLADRVEEIIEGFAAKPLANANGPYVLQIGREVTLSSANSFSPDDDPIVSYEWDLDNDGVYDVTTSDDSISTTFEQAYDGMVVLRVTTESGLTALGTAETTATVDGRHPGAPDAPTDIEVVSTDGGYRVTFTPADDVETQLRSPNGDVYGIALDGDGTIDVDRRLARSGRAVLYSVNAFGTSAGVDVDLASYEFEGFRAPVDAAPEVNELNAGRTLPVAFSLGEPPETIGEVLVDGATTSTPADCDTWSPLGDGEAVRSPGTSGLQDHGDGVYQLNWDTSRAWRGTCRTFELALGDGTIQRFLVAFRRGGR